MSPAAFKQSSSKGLKKIRSSGMSSSERCQSQHLWDAAYSGRTVGDTQTTCCLDQTVSLQLHNCCHTHQCRMDVEVLLPNNLAKSMISFVHVYTKHINGIYISYTRHIPCICTNLDTSPSKSMLLHVEWVTPGAHNPTIQIWLELYCLEGVNVDSARRIRLSVAVLQGFDGSSLGGTLSSTA